jgi:hypothetical protein
MSHFGPSHLAYRIRLRRPVRHQSVGSFSRVGVPAASSAQCC